VTSNNISNVNTVGYKASRAQYSDTFSNLLKPMVPNTTNTGAKVPPTQIGGGVQIESVQAVFSQGTIQTSANNSDLAVAGAGFFIVKDPLSGKAMATRSGNFRLDADGFLVTQQGHRVQGAYGASTVVEYDSSNGEVSVQSVNDNIKLAALSMTSNDPEIPVTSTANLAIGMVVSGPGIPYGAKIINKDDVNLTITLSAPPSVTTGDPLESQAAITLESGSLFADISPLDISTFSAGYPVVADAIPVGTRVISVNGVSTGSYPLTLNAPAGFTSAPAKGTGFVTLAQATDAANLRVGMKVVGSGGNGGLTETYRITKIVGTTVTFDKDLTDSHVTFVFTPTITLSDSATATPNPQGKIKYIADKNKSFANLSFGDKYKPALLTGDVRISFDEGADKDYTFVDQNGAALSGLNLANARSMFPS